VCCWDNEAITISAKRNRGKLMEKTYTILVVDDEPSIRMGLAATIRRYGYEVITAVNGDDGFIKARQSLPDLIVSDVMMPDLNGFEMKKQMGEDPVLASIPFIFLTARTATQDRVAGMREGADDYVTKPFVTEELVARIEAVLRRVKTEQERGANRENMLHRRRWKNSAKRSCKISAMSCARRWAT